jgi:AraC-like DNA-binding protein
MTTSMTERQAHGLRLVHVVSEYSAPTHGYGGSELDMVRLHIALHGEYGVHYPAFGRRYERLVPHCSLFYAHPFELEHDSLSPRLETFGIQFPVERFIAYADGASPRVSRFCDQIANGKAGMLFEPTPALLPAIERSVRRMIACRYDGSVEQLFLYSQSLELLVRVLNAADGGDKAGAPRSPGRSDRERLFAARDYLEAQLSDPPALAEVARKVGLNEYKLKRGFKQLFGTTVHAYLTDKRLEHARSLLLDTDRTAAEVAFALGYSSPQHFSQAFKQHFGIAPKSMRKTS